MRKIGSALLLVVLCAAFSFATQDQSVINMNSWINQIRTTIKFNPPIPNQMNMYSTEALEHFQLYPQQRYSVTRFLNANKQYLFLASGDNGTKDIDMFVYDQNNQMVTQDTLADADAACAYRPYQDGMFRIEVFLHEANMGDPMPAWLCFQLFQVP